MEKTIQSIGVAIALLMGAPALAQDAPDQESQVPEFGDETTTETQDAPAEEGFFTPPGKSWAYPTPYTARPLTMQGRMLRGTFRLNFRRAFSFSFLGGISKKVGVSMDLGAAFAINDDLEVGISSYRLGSSPPNFAEGFLPIVFSPDGDFGDIPIYGRYRFLNEDNFEMAADLVLRIPTGTDFGMTIGAPFRYKGLENLAIDTGAEFSFQVTDPDATFSLLIPVKLTFNITDEVFIHGATGIGFGRLLPFSGADVGVFAPLSFGGGYTLMIKDKIMMDINGEFGFRPLFQTGSGDNVDLGNTWFVGVGANVYTEPLGK